jgi:hypothetical protein
MWSPEAAIAAIAYDRTISDARGMNRRFGQLETIHCVTAQPTPWTKNTFVPMSYEATQYVCRSNNIHWSPTSHWL